MDIRETGIDGANWFRQAQDSPMSNFCEHGDETLGSIKEKTIV